jgi:predicted phosphodiesterase
VPPRKKRSRAAATTTPAPPPRPVLGHAEILAALQAAFPSGVYLLSRLADPSLRLSDPTPHVFLPDTHIVPGDEIERWPGRVLTPSRVDVLETLLDTLDGLRAIDPALVVWQLGDLIDLWRTGDAPGLSLKERLQRLRGDWRSLLSRFEPTASLPIRRVFGNHDEDLRGQPGIDERQFVPEDPGHAASNDMLVTHGHQYDPIEDLPGALKEFFMRGLTERITPYARDFMAATNPHWSPEKPDLSFEPPTPPRPGDASRFLCPGLTPSDPVPLASTEWNVGEVKLVYHPDANPLGLGTGASAAWQDDRNPSLWERGKLRAREASWAGYSVALVVVGHTHHPRIIRGQQPDGSPFVLMDCGGWIGPRFLSPAISQMVHNCTIGVRVGGDLRLYQLTADPYDWPH